MMTHYTINLYIILDDEEYTNPQLEKLIVQRLEQKGDFVEVDCEVMEQKPAKAHEERDEPAPRRKLTRQEQLQELADSGTDTWEEYRGEK